LERRVVYVSGLTRLPLLSADGGEVGRVVDTGRYLVGQTPVVIVWIILNAAAVTLRWDPYSFILLNLGFSTQAAYAAPLILLAQNRQPDREDVVEPLERLTHAIERLQMEVEMPDTA
jgi:uncharacterized membrane protein